MYAILEKVKTTEKGKRERKVVARGEGVKGWVYEPAEHRVFRAGRTDYIGWYCHGGRMISRISSNPYTYAALKVSLHVNFSHWCTGTGLITVTKVPHDARCYKEREGMAFPVLSTQNLHKPQNCYKNINLKAKYHCVRLLENLSF